MVIDEPSVRESTRGIAFHPSRSTKIVQRELHSKSKSRVLGGILRARHITHSEGSERKVVSWGLDKDDRTLPGILRAAHSSS